MELHVGVLYSAQDLLEILPGLSMTSGEFLTSFGRFKSSSAKSALELSQKANWIEFDERGHLLLTPKGRLVTRSCDRKQKLRHQLKDVVTATKPTWAGLISKGRKETIKFLSENTVQCFYEAGLLAGTSEDVVAWWDWVANATRTQKTQASLEIGRVGERLSLAYESIRIGKTPDWVSIESNLAGYDVLSWKDSDHTTRLKIEVKTSDNDREFAYFYLSANEWLAAQIPEYVFHFWLLRPTPKLFTASPGELKAHIPQNVGSGEWESVRIPFANDHLVEKIISIDLESTEASNI